MIVIWERSAIYICVWHIEIFTLYYSYEELLFELMCGVFKYGAKAISCDLLVGLLVLGELESYHDWKMIPYQSILIF